MSVPLWSAGRLAASFRRGVLSPLEAATAIVDQMERMDGQVHAFVTRTPELALAMAAQSTDRFATGSPRSPIDGVPVSIKDLEPTAGIRTTYGHSRFRDFVPDHDAPIVERLRAAGTPLLGKTNTPYLGFKDMTDNDVMEPTLNPWDPARTAGGSSGGAAAAVATGMGPIATGGDGAGSIRIPAALCGVVGFKPTFGLIPHGTALEPYASLSHKGPLTRTVADAALMVDAVAGRDGRDPTSFDPPWSSLVDACGGELAGKRLAVSADFGYAPVDPAVRSAVAGAADVYAELGAEVGVAAVPWSDPIDLIRVGWTVQFAARVGEEVVATPDDYEPELREFARAGAALSAVDHVSYLAARHRLSQQMREFFEQWDLLLCPAMPAAAWPVDAPVHRGPSEIDGVVPTDMFERLRFTFPFNLTGLPALAFPIGRDREGLPLGGQLVAGRWRDDLVVAAAARYEEARPWADQWPPDVVL